MASGQIEILERAHNNELRRGLEVTLKNTGEKVTIASVFLLENNAKSYLIRDSQGVVKPAFENNICRNGKER